MTAAAREAALNHRTLAELVLALEARGDAPALAQVRGGAIERLSAGELGRRASGLARGLAAMGVGRGECVLLWAPNSLDWVIVRLALVACGAIGVALDELTSDAELAVLVPDSGARRAFVAAANLPRLAAAAPALETWTFDESPRRWTSIADAPGQALPALDPDDDVAIVYTSGTTGRPKSFALTHANILANVRALGGQGLVGRGDRILLPLPLHHVYPLTVGIFVALASEVEVVLPESVAGPQLVAALVAARCTGMLGVPRLYAAIADGVRAKAASRGRLAARAFDLLLRLSIAVRRTTGKRIGRHLFGALHRTLGGELRLLASGGAKFEAELIWTLEGLGFETLSGYGLAETASIFTNNHRGKARIGSEGWVLAGGELRIADPDGEGVGEIQMRGPSVFRGYRNDDAANAAAFTTDGWFRTGDLGRVDADRYVWVTGRSKEMIVLGGGKKIYPEELEKHYATASNFAEIALFERDGALLALVVPDLAAIAASGSTRVEDVVRVGLAERGRELAPYQRPAGFAIAREKLPRTRLGKIRRFELARLFDAAREGRAERAAAPLTDADRALLADPLATELLAWLRARHPRQPIDLDTSPQLDLGIDSLAWITITLELAERFGIALTDEDGAGIVSVRDLLQRALARSRAPEPAAAGTLSESDRAWIGARSPGERVVGKETHALNAAVARLAFGLRVEGRELVPDSGAVVIAANHASDLDPPMLAAALAPRLRSRLWWSGDVGRLFGSAASRAFSRAVRIFPVRERAPSATLAFARELLGRGEILAWFPESWRTPDGALQPFRPGIGHLLLAADAAVVPCFIAGTYEAWPRHRRWPRPARVTVRFGAPIAGRELAALGTAEAIAARLRDAVAALQPGRG